jgi:hypothetical protein
VQLLLHEAPLHLKTHSPPVQLFVHVEPGRHSNVQLPPPQVFKHVEPLSQTTLQFPPEQPVVQLAPPRQVIEQLPSAQFGLQFALHSQVAFAGSVVTQSLPLGTPSSLLSVRPGASETLEPSLLPPAASLPPSLLLVVSTDQQLNTARLITRPARSTNRT